MRRKNCFKLFLFVSLLFDSNFVLSQEIKKEFYPYANGPFQFKWELGSAKYYGDLADSKRDFEFYCFPRVRTNIKAGISAYFKPYWVLSANLFYLNVKGADDPSHKWSNGRGPNYNRGLTFSTHVVGFETLVSFPVFPKLEKKPFGIEPKLGLAVINYTPTTKLNEVRYNLRKVGTHGQYLSDKRNYSRFTLAIPYGFSIIYNASDYTHFTFSFHAYKLFTDYIDDVGNDKYITESYLEENNFEVSPEFLPIANPNNQSGYRSNTNLADFITTTSIGMNIQILKNWKYRKWAND